MSSIPQYTQAAYNHLTIDTSKSATQARLPPSPQFSVQQSQSQDTNYVGITISEDPPPGFSPSRHPYHGFDNGDRVVHPDNNVSRTAPSYKGLTPGKRQPAKRISDSSIYQSNITMPPQGPPSIATTNEKGSLARHSSAKLPSINANLTHLPPAPKLSHSATISGYDRQASKDFKQHAQSPQSKTSAFIPSPPTQSTSSNHVGSPSSASSLSPYSQRDYNKLKGYSGSAHSAPDSQYTMGSMLSPAPFELFQDDHWKRKENSAFRIVSGNTNLSRVSMNPPFRRSDLKPHFARPKPLIALTTQISDVYESANPKFKYNASSRPRRVLTKPSKPSKNDGNDNEDYDYILYVNDILGSAEGHSYLILDVLGAGTFGQVVKCQNTKTNEIVAVKVVKNKPAYFNQSMMELAILELLNERYDKMDKHHLLRLKDTFIHKKHLCLAFELLSVNLYELIKQNHFRGLSTNLVRVFTTQLLDALTVLNEAKIIHCDLKPENILLISLESPAIKIIDFGSACHETQTVYTYIQSRFYRSPEVLVGLPYSSSIDMWSLGCIAAELYLGLPLFPGSSEYNQISRIVEMLGVPPNYMIEMGKNSKNYFHRYTDEYGQKQYRLKSIEEYALEQNKDEQPSKCYFTGTTLPEIITSYPMPRRASFTDKEIAREEQNRLAFIDFLKGLLNLNHFERWSPQQAKQHPFITGEPFLGPFVPSMIPKSNPATPKTSSNESSPHGLNSYQSPILPVSASSQSQSSQYDSPLSQDRGNQAFLNLSQSPSRHSYQGLTSEGNLSKGTPKSSALGAPPLNTSYSQTGSSVLPLTQSELNDQQYQYTQPNSGLGITPLYENSLSHGYQNHSNQQWYSGMAQRSGPPEYTQHSTQASVPSNTSHTGYHDLGSVVTIQEPSRDISKAPIGTDGSQIRSDVPVVIHSSSRWNDVADLERNDAEDYGPGAPRGSGSLSAGTISNVASFHRRVRRPYNQQYQRQDLEWDGSGGLSPDVSYGAQNVRPSSYQDQSDQSWTMA
ncbi:kinase-like domain-containing protein [Umbelopsis sp. AD052]|nr:kinase-like domain-containing protein [Umbelopsis sp. AD052]